MTGKQRGSNESICASASAVVHDVDGSVQRARRWASLPRNLLVARVHYVIELPGQRKNMRERENCASTGRVGVG